MNFLNLTIQQEYRSPKDNVVTQFYLPALGQAVSYKRSVGYFSSSALEEIASGICNLARNGGKIELVASPYLSVEDEEAIRCGYENRMKIIENALLRNLKESQSRRFGAERLNLLACLVESGIMDIKIAFTENGSSVGMYHEKLGILEDADGNKIAFSGSMNESEMAMKLNYETIDVFCSWKSGERERVSQKDEAFALIWGNCDPKLKVVSFPAVNKAILEKYKRGEPDYELDEKEFWQERNTEYVVDHCEVSDFPHELAVAAKKKPFFSFPDGIAPRPYQIKAIENFRQNRFQSLFAMATGTGKTLTSLFAANELSQEIDLRNILIIVPLKDLVDQWRSDIEKYFKGTIISARSGTEWKEKITDLNLLHLLNKGDVSDRTVVITTYNTFCGNYEKILSSRGEDSSLVIADEVHKFGAESYSKKLPEKLKYRIGLSATPKRPYDDKGTKAVFDYFCPSENVYEFTIKDAIASNMLCHYVYYPVVVSLTDPEMEKYDFLSEKIVRISTWLKNSEKAAKEERKNLEKLLKARHRILEQASNKKKLFLDTMRREILKYKDKTIIFAPDGKDGEGNDFLEVYKSELWKILSQTGKIVSMAEYVQGTKKSVVDAFSSGAIDILFAKQRLNEGIDIPAARRAFFIASSTSEREFIQRRGRVLRKSPDKEMAEIFDFIVVPPDEKSPHAHSILDNEIKRAMNFAVSADNVSDIEIKLRKYL